MCENGVSAHIALLQAKKMILFEVNSMQTEYDNET